MRTVTCLTIGMALLGGGCEEQPPGPRQAPTATATTTGATGSASAAASAALPAPPLSGPPAASAAASAHEQAAYRLFAGGGDWAGLPERATDPGVAFDPKLPRRLGPTILVKAPRVRLENLEVVGRLPKEVIRRIARMRFGQFRLCYETALRANPSVEGPVTIRFVIDEQGKVTKARDGGSKVEDAALRSCVLRAFSDMTFPQPEGGVVQVVYSITFAPGT